MQTAIIIEQTLISTLYLFHKCNSSCHTENDNSVSTCQLLSWLLHECSTSVKL